VGCGRGEDRAQGVWLETHERWEFNASARVQVLRRLICLCTWCHTATHFGLAGIRGVGREAFAHLLTVTGMSAAAGEQHIDSAFALWRQRSASSWSLDLSILTDAGISLAHAADAGVARSQTAGSELRRVRKAEAVPAPSAWPKRTGWPFVNMQGKVERPGRG
jgi:hypothetical protein